MNTKAEAKAPAAAELKAAGVDTDHQIVLPDRPYSSRNGDRPTKAPAAQNLVEALAQAARDPHTDIDKMERLFAMHQRIVAQQAEAEWNDAMARTQANLEVITRDRRNDHTKSLYATLAAINEELMPLYSAEGLSLSYDIYTPEHDKDGKPINPPATGWYRVIAIVSHKGGHSRRYHLDAPLDIAGKDGTKNKTEIQAMGSTVSYLRRYLACMIFNIATADDDDGNAGQSAGGGGKLTDKEVADFLASIDAASDEQSLMRDFAKAYNRAEDLKDRAAQKLFLTNRDLQMKKIKAKGRR